MCKPLSQGGLCIRSIEKVNKALFGKWLWRVGELGQGLCQKIIIGKCKVGIGAWCVPFQANKIFGLWKSVYLFIWSLLGFSIGPMMVFGLNFGRMNGADKWCCLINS